jgi:7-carboxy-7-deazaguanine synthase
VRVSEIFRSIQGESYLAGLPCTFIRLAGCNLRCAWCDTAYAQDPASGKDMSVHEIVREIRSRGADLVEITGGEPLLQPETASLMRILLDMGARVLLETNGTFDVGEVDTRVTIVMDIKPPSSGHADANRWDNVEKLQETDEIKIVIADRADYDWAKRELGTRKIIGSKRISFSPVFGKLDYRPVAEWLLKDAIPVRLGVQLHKILWGPDARGV